MKKGDWMFLIFLAVMIFLIWWFGFRPVPPPPPTPTAYPTATRTERPSATFTRQPTNTPYIATETPTRYVSTPTGTKSPPPTVRPTATVTARPADYRWWSCKYQEWMDYPRYQWHPCK